MAKKVLGKVAVTTGGLYSPQSAYDKLTIVTYNGASYISARAVPAGVAPTDAAYWQLVADKGDKGDKGTDGLQGNSGFTGAADELEVVNNLTQGGAAAALSAEQGKALNTKVAAINANLPRIVKSWLDPYWPLSSLPDGFFIPRGSIVKNLGIKIAIAFDASLNGRIDLQKGDTLQVEHDYYHIQALDEGGEAHIVFNAIGEDYLSFEVNSGGLEVVESDDYRIKAFFKSIKLYNLPKVANPSISLFSINKNYNGEWSIKLIHTQEEYYQQYDYVVNYKSSVEESHIDSVSPQGVRFVADVDWSVLDNGEALGYDRGSVVFNSVIYHYHPVLTENAVTTDFLQEKSVTAEKVEFINSINLVDIESNDAAVGYYVYEGALSPNSDLNTTGYIYVKPNTGYSVISAGATQKARFVSFYDSNKNWLSDGAPLVESVLTPSQATYMRVTYYANEWNIAQVTEGDMQTYTPYRQVISSELIPPPDVAPAPILSAYHTRSIVANGQTIKLSYNECHRNVIVSAAIQGAISNVRLGVGENSYQGGYIELTGQEIRIYVEGSLIQSKVHGLSLANRTYITIHSVDGLNDANNQVADIVISSGGQEYKVTTYWYCCGEAFFTNNGDNLSVDLSSFPCNLNQDLWMFGDSYFGYANPSRWLHYAIKSECRNFLESFLAGGTSANAKASLESLLTIGTPRTIVWCLGMNDGSDSASEPSNQWYSNINWLVATCRQHKISLILATIPSVPTVNNEKKNEWVRNSGYRYIDFAAAVNAQPNGVWDADYLSADGVHPSVTGALTLYHQAIVDCPEMTKS